MKHKEPDRKSVPINMGPAILNDWLRANYTLYHISEIIIERDTTNTVMTISLKREGFSNHD